MKKVLLTYGFLLAGIASFGQNTLIPSVSNYHLTWTTINPAFTGFRDAISLSSFYRSAMYGNLGPRDMQLNVHTPVGNSKVALGGIVAYNNTPPDQNLFSLMTTYAYRMYLGNGRLALGLSAGVYGVSSDLSSIDLRDPNDVLFPDTRYQRWFPNFGTGVLYYSDTWFIGLSVPELLSIPREDQPFGSFNFDEYRFILTGAYLFDINENLRIKPSVLIDYNKASTSYKASLNVGILDSRVFIGGVYDHPNFAIALLNFKVNPQWLLGYAYTISLGPIRKSIGGSHEIVLRWEWRPVVKTIPDDPFYF